MTRRGWRASMALASLTSVVLMSGMTVATTAPIQLVAISSRTSPGTLSILIEASQPAPYITSQPDPLTLFVDLRNVSTARVVNRFSAGLGPVMSVDVEDVAAPDGSAVARVRMSLATPVRHEVHSTRGTIRVDFDLSAPDAPPPPTVRKSTVAAVATVLERIETRADAEGVTVLLVGNGQLLPSQVGKAADLPPRLFLDFPDVRSGVPPVTLVELGPIERVRVAPNSRTPLVTRVVLDLRWPAAYRIETPETNEHELRVIVFNDEALLAEPAIRAVPEVAEPAIPAIPEVAEPAIPAIPEVAEPAILAIPEVAELAIPAVPEVPEVMALASTAGPADVTDVVAAGRSQRLPANSVFVDPMAALRVMEAPEAMEALRFVGSLGLAAAAEAARAETRVQSVLAPAPIPPPAPLATASLTSAPASPLRTVIRAHQLGQGQVGQPQRQYTGHAVSFDFQNADLRAVLRTFAEISSLNIVIDPEVDGRVDVALRDVPWDQAFDLILQTNRLEYILTGNIIRIAPSSVLRTEAILRRDLAAEQELAGELVDVTRTLNYARAEALAGLLTQSVLSSRGQVQFDERTNTLIITDLVARLNRADELISALDRAEPQVEIEARIVQVNTDYAKALGIEWGINGRVAPELGNTTPLSFPNRGGLTGRTGFSQGPVGADARALLTENIGTAVNLGAVNATSAIGLALGSVSGAFNLDVALSALETEGKGRILSSPRITTQNNVTATIIQGDQIPIQTVANNTVTVTFQDAALTLTVTPQITAADTVIMQIELDNDVADFSRSVNGIPPIITQSASTTLQVADGQTTVIGGIFESIETERRRRTPGLSRIPLLGWLFKSEATTESSDELLIFVTPHILR